MKSGTVMDEPSELRCILLLMVLGIALTGCFKTTPPPVPVSEPEPPPQQARVEEVTAKQLNIRAQPSTQSPILDVLVKGERVEIVEVQDRWARIITPKNGEGWVYALGHLTGFPEMPKPGKAPSPQRYSSSGAAGSYLKNRAGPAHLKNQAGPAHHTHEPSVPERGDKEAPVNSGSAEAAAENLHGSSQPAPDKPLPATEISSTGTTLFIEMVPSPALLNNGGTHPTELEQLASRSAPDQASGGGLPVTPADGNPAMVPAAENARDNTSGNRIGQVSTVVVRDIGEHQSATIKSGPLFSSNTIGKVEPGTRLVCRGRVGDWYVVKSEHGTGYIHESWVYATTD